MSALDPGGRRASDVCAVEELEDGIAREVRVGRGSRLGVVRIGMRVYAFSGTCPHRGGPLGFGWVRPHVEAPDADEIEVDWCRPVLSCPWHNWEYDLETGEALFDRALRIRTYDVNVVDGRVLVSW
jgi:nitrite reductase/ring-hydroxylating ferredoxin subunit